MPSGYCDERTVSALQRLAAATDNYGNHYHHYDSGTHNNSNYNTINNGDNYVTNNDTSPYNNNGYGSAYHVNNNTTSSAFAILF